MTRPWTSTFAARFTKRRVFGLLGAGLLLGGLAACSHTPFHHGPGARAAWSDDDIARMRARFLDKATRELQLDANQQARLGALADAMAAQRKALMPTNGTTPPQRPREAMAALIQGDKFDRSGAQALLDAKTSAVREQAPQVVNAAADFFDSLQPEQQRKVREFLNRGGRHRFGFGNVGNQQQAG
jgi:Spy/CpxP family protein refolding chaperone